MRVERWRLRSNRKRNERGAKRRPFVIYAAMRFVYIFGFVIVITIWLILRTPSLNGFWEAPESFKKAAGLTVFCLYICDDFGYLLMANQSGIIANCEVKISVSWPILTRFGVQNSGTIEMNHGLDFIPEKMRVEYTPISLVMYDSDEICAKLYKNPEYE